MKITQIELYQSRIKLKEPFITSLELVEYAENVIVIIRTDEDISGFGECSPYMTINGETKETCFAVGKYLAGALLGKDPVDIEACSGLMDKTIYGNSSIKSAFDIALYDIASQHAGLPLFAFLGGKNNKTLYTDYTVSLSESEKMSEDALKIKNNGFQIIKVKLGESKEKDVERIRQIRKAVGKDMKIRIDANQGWNAETAISTLKALAPFEIEYCEEPIPRWDFMQLQKVREQSPIPIMADESCSDHHDAQRLIDLQSCDYFNLKLGKSSGIFKAMKIIRLAEQSDVRMQVGGFVESRLGFTAAAHLALTSDYIQFCDFDTPLMFEDDPVRDGIRYSENGKIIVPDSAGLGAVIDEDYLQRLTNEIVS